jgi:peroxin-2
VSLDTELNSILGAQASGAFKYLHADAVAAWRPELDAALSALVWRYTVAADRPSPGALLQNLEFHNNDYWHDKLRARTGVPLYWWRQKVALVVFTVGARYGWLRLRAHMLDNGWARRADWRRVAYQWCHRLHTALRAASILNFLAFLVRGTHVSLLERFVNARRVTALPRQPRQVNFDFMHQQLLWHGISEFSLFAVSLINVGRITGYGRRAWRYATSLATGSGSGGDVDSGIDGGDGGGGGGGGVVLQRGACPVCAADPITTPYVASCGHVYCYYCLRGSRIDQPSFACFTCGDVISSDRPLRASDV